MATFTVTTSADNGAGSLRAAVAAANASAGVDVIAFDAAVFDGEAEDLIRLTSGQIEITEGLTITGGPSGVTITGDAAGDDVTQAGGITDVDASLAGEDRLDDNSRIFDATADLTIDGLTLTGGRTTSRGESGGAVRGTFGTTLTLIDSTVSGNSTVGDYSSGGGVTGSAVTLTNSIVSGNSTAGEYAGGGGVAGSAVTLTNSTVSRNGTGGDDSGGGGIWGYSSITLTDSTVSGNSTAGEGSRGGGVRGFVTLANSTVNSNSTAGEDSEGGGVYGDTIALTNSTVSGNSTAGDSSGGGGIWGRHVTVTSSTVSGNSTAGEGSEGGGVYGGSLGVMLTNSLVLGNTTIFAGGDEVEGAVTRTGGNILGGDLFDGDADVGDVTATEVFAATTEIAPGVLAGVLADNGGPTRTILIAADGPAVNAGGATVLPTDQRGLERLSGAAVDLGAVESGAGPAEPRSLNVTTALDVVANDGLTSLREAVFFANLEQGTDTITFDASVFDGEAGDVIRLTSGQIDLTEALILVGGPAGVTITGDANGDDLTRAGGITDVDASLEGEDRLDDNSRIFDTTADLTLDGLTLTGGRTAAFGEGGGAVRGGIVTLIDSTVSGNSTAGNVSEGGGIEAFRVTLIDSTVSGNSTAGFGSEGGGVYGSVTLTNSTVSGNSTTGERSYGGGISGQYVTLTNSTVSDNSTAGERSEGGGVYGDSSVTLTNSTVSGNSTAGQYSRGGGISSNSVTLTNSTVGGNSTTGDGSQGGGVYGLFVTLANSTVGGNSTTGYGSRGGGILSEIVTLTNSTVSGNSTAGNISEGGGVLAWEGTLTNSIVLGNATLFEGVDGDEVGGGFTLTGGNILGGNRFDGAADVGDVTAAEVFAEPTEIAPGVRAGVLADNGGPTQTIAIRADGPAAGAADPETALSTDQRGFARDDAPDLGAFEAGAEGGLKLFGGPEANVLVGGAGGDRIWGRGGNDLLQGLAGDDVLRGGKGCDILNGGTDDDLLSGGKGRDVFIFGPDSGADTIVGFDANPHCGQDRMDLRALGISATSFASAVTIAQIDNDTRITLQSGGSILCTGIDGEGVAVIDQSDFLLLA